MEDPSHKITAQITAPIEARHWWFAGRRRILHEICKWTFSRWPPKDPIYDIGCGVGANFEVLKNFEKVVGADIAPEALEKARLRGYVDVIQTDAQTLDRIPNNAAGGLVALDILEHLKDDLSAMSSIKRILHPGSAAILTVPAFHFLWGAADELTGHLRRYDRSSFMDLVKKSGLVIERITYFNSFLFLPILAVRQIMKGRTRERVEFSIPPTPINEMLKLAFSLEAPLLKYCNLPIGVSIACVARRPLES